MEVCLEVTRLQLAKHFRFVKELKALGQMWGAEHPQEDPFQQKSADSCQQPQKVRSFTSCASWQESVYEGF
jgi:hypothetical protein